MVLQNILFPTEEICKVTELYYHQDGLWDLFNGYFNAFYVEKHRKYTFMDSLKLVVRCYGYDRIELMKDENILCGKDLNPKEELLYELEYPYKETYDGVFWFRMRRTETPDANASGAVDSAVDDNDKFELSGWYEGAASGYDCNPVMMGVDICTFRREKYVLRNMHSLRRWAEEGDDVSEVSAHMHVFLIDNGQTLSSYPEFMSLRMDRIGLDIIPNMNTGGSGGFSRGMIEAMNRREELGLTHLLLMDDDAVFDPDLFVRLYGFLSFLKTEYRRIAVGGALFREDYPYIQHASGEWFENFLIINEHPLTDMRSFDNVSAEWMTSTAHEKDRYGAWWCCCYPMEVITKENLPLPLFVHHDDIQFGMRLSPDNGVVFLNGINVWHQGFETTFTGVKQYYNTRNELISMKMYYPGTSVWSVKLRLVRRLVGSLVCMRYGDIELIHRAVQDYQKGADWLKSVDVTELNNEMMSLYKSIVPLRPIDEMDEKDGLDVLHGTDGLIMREDGVVETWISRLKKEASAYDAVISPEQLRGYYDHGKFKTSIWKKLTVNGWLLPGKKGICLYTPLDSPWKPFRYKTVALYEPANGKCAIMQRDYSWFRKTVRYSLEILTGFSF